MYNILDFSFCEFLYLGNDSLFIGYMPVLLSAESGSSFLKEYIVPFINPFLSAALGAFTAYLTFNSQDKLKIEKNKIDSINKKMLEVQSAYDNLIAIKSNYAGCLDNNPIQRMLAVPTILIDIDKLSEDIYDLSFLIMKKNKSISQNYHILAIRAMIHNYNTLLGFWEKRNELNEDIRAGLRGKMTDGTMSTVSKDEVIETLGIALVCAIIDINERVITLTDALIIEFKEFLLGFPKEAKCHISKKVIKRYGGVLNFIPNNSQEFNDLLKKSPDVDLVLTGQLMNEDPEVLSKRYDYTS